MIKKLKILLINPFFLGDRLSKDQYNLTQVQSGTACVDPPLGIGSLSAYIRKNIANVEIQVYDANAVALNEIINKSNVDMEHLYALVESKIRRFAPDIVGISALFEFMGNVSLRFVDLVKKVNKDIITIMGGSFASYSYRRAFEKKNLDFAIKGEGEEGFRQFIEYILSERSVDEVGSLIYRKNGQILLNTPVLVDDLNTMPWVDRTNFFMELYATYPVRLIRRYSVEKYEARLGSILTSRGCPYKCGFCSTRLLWGKNIRCRSISDVMEEIRWLKNEFGINTFFFPDDNIATDRKRFVKFLKKLRKENIKWLSGGFQISAMTDEAINLCIESGLLYFPMAFESGSNDTLKKIRKPLRIEQSKDFVKRARSINNEICIFGGWITGLPFETMADIEKTHVFAKHLDLDWSSFYCYQPYPGTEIYRLCVEKGYVKESENNVKGSVPLLEAISTEHFSADEVIFKNYCANIDINFLNNRNLKGRGSKDQAGRDFIDIINNYPTHVFAHFCMSKYFKDKNDKKMYRYHLSKSRECAKQDHFFEPYIKYFNLSNIIGVRLKSTLETSTNTLRVVEGVTGEIVRK